MSGREGKGKEKENGKERGGKGKKKGSGGGREEKRGELIAGPMSNCFLRACKSFEKTTDKNMIHVLCAAFSI